MTLNSSRKQSGFGPVKSQMQTVCNQWWLPSISAQQQQQQETSEVVFVKDVMMKRCWNQGRGLSSFISIGAVCTSTILSPASSSTSSASSLSRTRSLTLELKAEALREKGKLLPYLLDCQIYCSLDGKCIRAVANCAGLCFPLTFLPFWWLNSSFSMTAARQKGSGFESNWRAFTPTVVNVSSSLNGKRYTWPYGLSRMAALLIIAERSVWKESFIAQEEEEEEEGWWLSTLALFFFAVFFFGYFGGRNTFNKRHSIVIQTKFSCFGLGNDRKHHNKRLVWTHERNAAM